MEGLLIVIILYFIFKAMAKKGKGTWQSIKQTMEEPLLTQPASAQPEPAQTEHAHREHGKRAHTAERKPMPAPTRLMTQRLQEGASTEGSEKYQPIKPTVLLNHTLYDYTGSLGVTTGEGKPSDEGTDTCDPTLAHRQASMDDCRNQTLDTNPSAVRVLPDNWNGDTAVQAMVFNVIFNRPRAWR